MVSGMALDSELIFATDTSVAAIEATPSESPLIP